MSCCDEDALFVRCGTTLVVEFDYVDENEQPITIGDLSARGSIMDCDGDVVLALTGTHLVVGDTKVTLTLASDVTPTLSPQNQRRELNLYIELFDASSPPVVDPFGNVPLVVLPDLTP